MDLNQNKITPKSSKTSAKSSTSSKTSERLLHAYRKSLTPANALALEQQPSHLELPSKSILSKSSRGGSAVSSGHSELNARQSQLGRVPDLFYDEIKEVNLDDLEEVSIEKVQNIL